MAQHRNETGPHPPIKLKPRREEKASLVLCECTMNFSPHPIDETLNSPANFLFIFILTLTCNVMLK